MTDGAFANIQAHMGPIFPLPAGQETPDDYLAYRPHCLRRDFLQERPDQFITKDIIDELMNAPTLADFRSLFDVSVHFAGHSGVGGDMSDVFTSTQDPAFYFHHAQLDRLWTQWQLADPQSRTYQVSDTITYTNSAYTRRDHDIPLSLAYLSTGPPSRNATIFDNLRFGHVGGDVEMWRVLDTQGQLCYRYE